MYELLTPSQMAAADSLTIQSGFPGIELMENAGNAVVKTVNQHFPNAESFLIVCGTGNNGGDGFVAARLLNDRGRDVEVFIIGDEERISGDAALALAKLDKSKLSNGQPEFAKFDVIIDALLGAGLDRPVEGELAHAITAINRCNRPIVSVDLPSGIDGRTGKIMGCAVKASCTVTFFRFKPGHLLMPGRNFCGNRSLHQIGICKPVLEQTGFTGFHNRPELWQEFYPTASSDGHKYDRGHTLVLSGPAASTGAARLMAGAALRSGSGLVTIASSSDAMLINAAHLTSIMLHQADTPADIANILNDQRMNCVALGPGMPPDANTCKSVSMVLEQGRITILDAGALTAFSTESERLFDAISNCNNAVFLLPHEGEFARLFGGEEVMHSKIDRAMNAAEKSGATIVLKGADTIVATPDGQISVADNAPPWLATAGSGDVLAGIVAGLTAQGMPAFQAASAAVWLHGDAANRLGPGLISSDLDEGLRQSIKKHVSTNLRNCQAIAKY
jgi:hydroxyethylthiazole kinase-like uncharacterized protein yjeF